MKRKPKPKFRVWQVMYEKEFGTYEVVRSTSYPHKSEQGYYVINHTPESNFRALTAREIGPQRKTRKQ